jgi:hypothetical protein
LCDIGKWYSPSSRTEYGSHETPTFWLPDFPMQSQ